MVQRVEKKEIVETKEKIVAIQIINFAFFNGLYLKKSAIDVAVHIAVHGYNKNTLREIVDKKIFKDTQCVMNCRRELVKNGILIEPKKRSFAINPEIGTEGNILYVLKVLYGSKD